MEACTQRGIADTGHLDPTLRARSRATPAHPPHRLADHFATLPEPRVERTKRHALGDILTIAAICAAGAAYILELKANYEALHAAVETYFAEAEREGWQGVPHQAHTMVDGGHGRVEVRHCGSASDSELLAYLDPDGAWADLASVGMVQRQRQTPSGTTRATHYSLTSLRSHARQFAASVRDHWGIENRVHWLLDLAFREDESRVGQGHAAKNLAVIRRLALTLLRADTTTAAGIKARRLKAGWDEPYLLRVLHGQ
jgi:predicted transposase YbfD/YdcC